MQHLQPNTYLQGGKYQIEKVLGQGGFGITYLAENTLYGTKVAIKEFFYSKECTRDYSTSRVMTIGDGELFEMLKRKFLKEANTLMSFNHPNIVRVYNSFEENGTAYYSMDYIDGIALDEYLKKNCVLSERSAVATIRRVAAALQYVHGRHYNHFDVKPANIFLRRSDNEVLLIDFGASKHYDSNTGSATTLSNACYSPGYAPIEQYNQGGVSTFTPETDIYSLGATLYKMLTGQTPPEPSVIIESGLPSLPSRISQGTKSAITAAMQINKQNRPHSISEFLNILDGDEATKVVDEDTVAYTNTQARTNTATTSNRTSSNASQNSGGMLWGWLVSVLIIIVGGVIWYHTSNSISFASIFDSSNDKQICMSHIQSAETDMKRALDNLAQAYNSLNNSNHGGNNYMVTNSALNNLFEASRLYSSAKEKFEHAKSIADSKGRTELSESLRKAVNRSGGGYSLSHDDYKFFNDYRSLYSDGSLKSEQFAIVSAAAARLHHLEMVIDNERTKILKFSW